MRHADEQHIAEPGLTVIDITAADEETATALVTALDRTWATSGPAGVRRTPAGPG
ncbi:DUF6207 family protein [Streptomyces sp. NPDC000594]|uniref:DUF6207 family protein n=1 Tax=Streptomyces sp. NPDC000594 TaxID=3154261 RepID=UPI00331AAAB6